MSWAWLGLIAIASLYLAVTDFPRLQHVLVALEFVFASACTWWIVLFHRRLPLAFSIAIPGLVAGGLLQLSRFVWDNTVTTPVVIFGTARLLWAAYLFRVRPLMIERGRTSPDPPDAEALTRQRLLEIAAATLDHQVSAASAERDFYSRCSDNDLLDVYSMIRRELAPLRYDALLREIRSRTETWQVGERERI